MSQRQASPLSSFLYSTEKDGVGVVSISFTLLQSFQEGYNSVLLSVSTSFTLQYEILYSRSPDRDLIFW